MEPKIEVGKGAERIYVENFMMRVIGGMHYVTLRSGEKEYTFAIPLAGSKAIGRGLTKQVEEIEKKNGITIDSRLSDEPLKSPLKMEDLGGADEPPQSEAKE